MTIKIKTEHLFWEPLFVAALIMLLLTGSMIMLCWALALTWWVSGDIEISRRRGAPESSPPDEEDGTLSS